MDQKKTIDVLAAIAAQKDYCLKTEAPHFAPYDGFCYYCRSQIYKAISVEAAGTELITKCPYCHKSFVD